LTVKNHEEGTEVWSKLENKRNTEQNRKVGKKKHGGKTKQRQQGKKQKKANPKGRRKQPFRGGGNIKSLVHMFVTDSNQEATPAKKREKKRKLQKREMRVDKRGRNSPANSQGTKPGENTSVHWPAKKITSNCRDKGDGR